jgi:hypothetical protein
MRSGPQVRGTIPTATMGNEPPRLKLHSRTRPRRRTGGYVDGVWWPRSLDLSTELPGLLAMLAARLGPIARMTYLPNGWDPSARHMNADGTLVRLGRHGWKNDAVDVMTSSGHHLLLDVLPVATGTDTAGPRRAMWAPSRGGERAGTGSGVLGQTPGQFAALTREDGPGRAGSAAAHDDIGDEPGHHGRRWYKVRSGEVGHDHGYLSGSCLHGDRPTL